MKQTGASRGQLAVLLALIGIFLVILAFAPSLKSSPLTTTEKKLRAKAGTERKNVRALVSNTTSSTPTSGTAATRDKPLEGWEAPKNADRLKEQTSSEKPDAIAELVYAPDPARSLLLLQEHLATIQDLDAIARVYTAMAKLHAFRDPPDLAASAQAFEHAAQLAPTAEARHEIAREHVATLHADTDPEAVVTLVDAAVRPEDMTTLTMLELTILKAAALEKLARRDEADTLYKTIMAEALAARDGNALRAEDIYRQAAMRLARLYRESGREKDAQAVARDVRRLTESAQ